MQTVDYSYTCCDIVESVCLSVYALVTRLSEPCKNRLNRLRIRDAIAVWGWTDSRIRGLVCSVCTMGATWRVWLNGLCTIANIRPGINFHRLDINLSKQYLRTHAARSGVFNARCNIYISRLCYDASVRLSVRLSVTEVHWRIIANLGFKFRSHFTAPCGRVLLTGAVLSGAVLLAVLLAGGSSRAMLASARLSCYVMIMGLGSRGVPRQAPSPVW